MDANNGCSLHDLSNGPPVGGTVVAAHKVRDVVTYAMQVGQGRVFTWGDEWIVYDTFWSKQPNLPPRAPSNKYDAARFWQNMIGWVPPSKMCQIPVADAIL